MAGMIHLIYNTVVVILFIFILRLYKNDNHHTSKWKSQLLIGVISSVTIVLCMSSPFQIVPGYIFDLRTIPFLVGILYGGYLGGGLSALTLYLYRFYIGGGGVWNVWIVYSFILVLAFLIIPFYEEGKRAKKKWTLTSLALITATLMLVNTNFRVGGLPSEEWFPGLLYLLLHGLMAWMTVHAMEGKGTDYRLFLWHWGLEQGKKGI